MRQSESGGPADAADLLERARLGDRDALAGLLKSCDQRLRAVVARRIPRRLQALLSVEDVLQHAYTEAICDIAGFRPEREGSFLAWMTRLAVHNLLDAIRALDAEKRGGDRQRIVEIAGRDALDAAADLAGSITQTSPSRRARRVEADETLQRALRRLPEDHRRVIQLYDLDGCAISEVSREMSRSPGAIHLLRFRAHRRLRELLTGKTTFFRDSS